MEKISDVIAKFKQYESTSSKPELEIRADIGPEIWKQIYDRYNKKIHVTEGTVTLGRVISESPRVVYRQTITHLGGKAVKREFMQKTTVTKIDYPGKIRAALAIEKPVENDELVGLTTTIRFRHRISVPWETNWRLDLTTVLQLDGAQLSMLKQLIAEFFSNEHQQTLPTDWNPPTIGKYNYEAEIEYIGTGDELRPADISLQVQKLTKYTSPGTVDAEYENILKRLSSSIRPNVIKPSLKELSNNPIIFTKNMYARDIFPRLSEIFVCEKTDGERVFIVAGINIPNAPPNMIITGSNVEPLKDEYIKRGTKSTENPAVARGFILDAEMVGDKYYAFDLLYYGNSLVDLPYADRLEQLSQVCSNLTGIVMKTQRRTDPAGFSKVAAKILAAKHPYKIDGLIFTGNGTYYDEIYKWKQVEEQTFDLLVISADPLAGIAPWLNRPNHKLYILFCSIDAAMLNTEGMERIKKYTELLGHTISYNNERFPIQFSPPENPLAYMYYHPISSKDSQPYRDNLHGHIAEFSRVLHTSEPVWLLKKMRPDRDIGLRQGRFYGNNYRVANITYENTVRPVTVADLSSPPEIPQVGYFNKEKTTTMIPPTKFNLFVKAMVMRQFMNMDFVIDLCCGRGQDLFILSGYRVREVLAVDRDVDALEELANRKSALTNPDLYHYGMPRHAGERGGHHQQRIRIEPPLIHTQRMDVGEMLERRVSRARDIPVLDRKNRANALVINFAIHYFTDTAEKLHALLDFVDEQLLPGGIFLYTAFGGEQIHHLLQSGNWHTKEAGVTKYHIKKLYTSDTLTPAGQKISVQLPFSTEPMDEYLVNNKYIIEQMRSRGYKLRQCDSFGNWFGQFAGFSRGRELHKKLTDDDRKFCSLYQYVSFIKQ
jgi:hypothetical protein